MSSKPGKHEQKFFQALKDLFIGAKVEGESGFINLMRIKSRYFENGVLPHLKQDIDEALQPFPEFREELFDKLYSFFHRYFSETGSIYFRYTPLHQNIYERVYTDDRDVMLFWKTHMLYYVKTDRLFRSMDVEVAGRKFYFDVSGLEHKKANEKRSLVYEFKEKRADGALVFSVAYSEKGRKTKVEEILRAIKRQGQQVDEDILEQAFRVFERQSEVDYFINKNARAFLREQFDLWLYQYVFSGEGEAVWTEKRLRQLQTLKNLAYKIIDFVSQFEDELVRVWNKPKFVLNSHYVITLDRIAEKDEGLLARLLEHPRMPEQVAEWRYLGMVGEDFQPQAIWKNDLLGRLLQDTYRFLPLDTKYFPDLEPDLLALFDHLDQELDGWLIKSENYQALNNLLHKFREKVKCIHIDPPYNTDTSGFLYQNKYQHASWLTMMFDRCHISASLLTKDGSFLCHIDENECERLQMMLDIIGIPNRGTVVWDKRNPMLGKKGIATQHEYICWRSYRNEPVYLRNTNIQLILRKSKEIIAEHGGVTDQARQEFARWILNFPGLTGGERAYKFLDDDGRVYRGVAMGAPEPRTDPKFFEPIIHPVTKKPCPVPPNGWSRSPTTIKKHLEKGEIIFGPDEKVQPQLKVMLTEESQRQFPSIIQNSSRGKGDVDALGLDFPYCHPVSLYEELIGAAASGNGDICLDHFAGSGTTGHAVINLNRQDGGKRKYILVEMADYFDTVLLPRIKKVIFCEKWKDGKAAGGPGLSHFLKYYHLEQYEDTLRRAHYGEADLFRNPYESPYSQYVFLKDKKFLEALELDREQDTVRVDLSRLYEGIDLAETLSCVTGKWIRRLTRKQVEFEDGTKVDLRNPPWHMIKPLIWW